MRDPWALVCGESLTDLVPSGDSGELWRAVPGGSPFNTSLALARLRMPTALFSRLASDGLGEQAHRLLRDAGVDDSFLQRTERPTTLAMVDLGSTREATYSFYWAGTANDDWNHEQPLPALDPDHPPAVVHVASLASVISPSREVLLDWYRTNAADVPLSFDVNVRPVMIPQRDVYLERLRPWLDTATVIKASEEDLAFLFPGQEPADVARHLLDEHPRAELVMVTRGGAGVGVFRPTASPYLAPAVATEVVDTVGAGDTFTAGFLQARYHLGLDVDESVRRASVAGALACTKPGCNPPTLDELDAALA